MQRSQALPYISFAVDTALSERKPSDMPRNARLVGWQCGFELLFVAVWPVRHMDWISVQALCATILTTHLGLLVWEVRYVSISLAHPGLKPRQPTKN